ncbi:MAG: penicillin-binding protein 2 [Lachnospiraceae bacterium]|nr:penicillin-binding protein 2 [Lachnospiraceae bacterium]
MSRSDRRPFNKKMQEKLVVLFLIVLLAFVGLSIKLVTITRDNGESYKKQVLSQQQYESTVIPFKRGDILDSKGNKLATSEKVYNLIIDSKQMLRKEESLDATMSALSTCFPGFPESEVRSYVSQNPASQYYVTLKSLSYDDISGFVEMQNDKTNYPDIAGVWFEEEYRRVYPNNTLACDVIGFTGKDNVGSYGLEQYYNDTLNGTNGREYGYLSEGEMLERTVVSAVDGYNIVTTIDGNIQQIVEKYLYQFNEEHKNGARPGGNGANNVGCIIMDVNTGDILAMASYPNYDLNNPRDKSALLGSRYVNDKGLIEYEANIVTEENIDELLIDDATTYQQLNYLWKNYCISNTFEPGSVAKPITVAAGLESGKMTGNEYYTCNGQLHVGDHDIKCHNYKTGGDGTLSVQEAVEMSCNVALMLMGRQIGKTTFLEYQEKFNFGLKTNIDLYGESRTNTLVFNQKNMGETELATSTFGQGYNVTMIQMIAAYASLVNGGYYYEPHVVKRITAQDGSTVQNISPRVLKQTVSAATSAKIVQYCNGVVTNGTGKTARPAGYAIGGKTGTAETIPRDKKNYVVSFMGYAPADNPQIAIYVVVDRPNVIFQDDAKYATKIVRNILTEVLPYMNIYMTEELSDKEREELENLDIAIKSTEEEVEGEEGAEGEGEVEGDGEEVIDAHGGDITSSTTPTAEEMESDDVLTAPLTGSVLNTETGAPIIEENDDGPN